MARCKGGLVRRRMYQLRVVDLLARELSLEYEARQEPQPGAACLPSASSGSDGAAAHGSPGGRPAGARCLL